MKRLLSAVIAASMLFTATNVSMADDGSPDTAISEETEASEETEETEVAEVAEIPEVTDVSEAVQEPCDTVEGTGSRYDADTHILYLEGDVDHDVVSNLLRGVTDSGISIVVSPAGATLTGCSSLFQFNNDIVSIDLTGAIISSGVTSMSRMFYGLSKLTSLDLGDSFDVSNITDMSNMFAYCSSLTDLELGDDFTPGNARKMNGMFANCNNLEHLDFGSRFLTLNATNMKSMFESCGKLGSIDLGDWFMTSKVTDMSFMFNGCSSLSSLDLGDRFDTSSCTDMRSMFCDCNKLESVDLGDSFDTSNVAAMGSMFSKCSSLQSLDLGGSFNTGKVTGMTAMFSYCRSLTSLDLGVHFDTSRVNNMNSMFYMCDKLTNLNLGPVFDTSSADTMSLMFRDCSSFRVIDLGNHFDVSNAEDISYMFMGCSKLESIFTGCDWDTSGIRFQNNVFTGCTLLKGGSGTSFDPSAVDKTYARIDGGTDHPGYFTSLSHLEGYTISLDGSVGVNMYMSLSPSILEYDDPYMEFTLPDGRVSRVYLKAKEGEDRDLAYEKTVEEKQCYVFSRRLNAKQTGDEITAVFVFGNGESSHTYSFSVETYFYALQRLIEEGKIDSKYAAVAASMILYGKSARCFFGYNDSGLEYNVVKNEIDIKFQYLGFDTDREYDMSLLPDQLKFVGSTMALGSEVSLKLYFDKGILFTGAECTNGDIDVRVADAGGFQTVVLRNIPTSQLDRDFTIRISTSQGSFTVTASPMVYCASVIRDQSSYSDRLVTLIKGLAIYNFCTVYDIR
ncbi:MAG: BspA family leucine-rich repeat surface protein [Clostridiales bacterium]|nr:BspA family leucine-rich repeat surface protein [Clostridiales bacterium]